MKRIMVRLLFFITSLFVVDLVKPVGYVPSLKEQATNKTLNELADASAQEITSILDSLPLQPAVSATIQMLYDARFRTRSLEEKKNWVKNLSDRYKKTKQQNMPQDISLWEKALNTAMLSTIIKPQILQRIDVTMHLKTKLKTPVVIRTLDVLAQEIMNVTKATFDVPVLLSGIPLQWNRTLFTHRNWIKLDYSVSSATGLIAGYVVTLTRTNNHLELDYSFTDTQNPAPVPFDPTVNVSEIIEPHFNFYGILNVLSAVKGRLESLSAGGVQVYYLANRLEGLVKQNDTLEKLYKDYLETYSTTSSPLDDQFLANINNLVSKKVVSAQGVVNEAAVTKNIDEIAQALVFGIRPMMQKEILKKVISNHKVKLLNFLLDIGFNPNISIDILIEATKQGNIGMVELLLKYKADPNLFDDPMRQFFGPLYYAIEAANVEMVKLLVDRGANPLVEQAIPQGRTSTLIDFAQLLLTGATTNNQEEKIKKLTRIIQLLTAKASKK